MDKMIDEAIKQKFIQPLDNGIKQNLIKLKNTILKHQETKSLLKQVNKTLKKSNNLLKQNDFIDANSLLRSAIEYLAMAMLIEEDEETYNEYIDLFPEERKKTNPTKIVKKFGRKLKKYCPELFNDTNRNEREKIFEEIYETLCSYTHSSILINLFDNINDKNDKQVLKMFIYINYYFVKLVYYFCLKYITKNTLNYLDVCNIMFSFVYYIEEINIFIKEKNISFQKYNKYLNVCNRNIDYLSVQQDQIKEILKDIEKIELNDEEKELITQAGKKYFDLR